MIKHILRSGEEIPDLEGIIVEVRGNEVEIKEVKREGSD